MCVRETEAISARQAEGLQLRSQLCATRSSEFLPRKECPLRFSAVFGAFTLESHVSGPFRLRLSTRRNWPQNTFFPKNPGKSETIVFFRKKCQKMVLGAEPEGVDRYQRKGNKKGTQRGKSWETDEKERT